MMIDKGNQYAHSSATFSATNFKWLALELAINNLNHGIVIKQ
jgi:hypothetical protein